MTMLADDTDFVIGVDTHRDTHTASIVHSGTGAQLGSITAATSQAGLAELVAFADRHPGRKAWAVEGTGSYGVGLLRFLTERGELVVETERPHRVARRRGKSDEIDATKGARDALAAVHNAQPRERGERAAIAALLVTRRSAVDGAATARKQLRADIVTAPHGIRERFDGAGSRRFVTIAQHLRHHASHDIETATAITVMVALAKRIRALDAEALVHEKAMRELIVAWRPELLDQLGVGTIVAATVLSAWSHPGRFRSEAAFASLAGVAPIPASSGLTTRHRLNRSGDRRLNSAIYTIVISRLHYDPATRAYAERRKGQGKTGAEIRRCLQRYIARDLYRLLENPPTTT
jgi:transposase